MDVGRVEVVVAGVEEPRAAAVLDRVAGPVVGVLAARGAVPARAAVLPDGLAEPPLELLVVVLRDLGADVDPRAAVGADVADRAEGVVAVAPALAQLHPVEAS